MSDDLPRAVWTGTFRLFGVDVRCSVLDNGQRVIHDDSLTELFEAMSTPGVDMGDLEAFARWQRGLE